MARKCDYSERSSSEEDAAELRNRIRDLEGLVAQLSNPTPSTSSGYELVLSDIVPVSSPSIPSYARLAFLDASLLEHVPFATTKVEFPIPEDITNMLGEWDDILSMTSQYFESVHVWMPIIGKSRLSRVLEKMEQELRPDHALLLLCMKLIQEVPIAQHVETSFIYMLAKQFSLRLEMAGCCSLSQLQANILIAVFELGHAILPSAYISIGNCAREATCLGIHDRSAPQLLPKSRGWVEWEERQRVWWFILILDRCEIISPFEDFRVLLNVASGISASVVSSGHYA